MNIKNSLFLLTITFLTAQAEIKIGNLSFNNTLNKPVSYTFVTKPSGTIPGINAPRGGITVNGRGEIPANTSKSILSSFKRGTESVWGETIDFKLQVDSNSFPVTIDQLGEYEIELKDGKVKLSKIITLEKKAK